MRQTLQLQTMVKRIFPLRRNHRQRNLRPRNLPARRKQPRSAKQKSEISLPTYAGLIGLTVFVFNLRTCLKFVREQDAMLADANGPREVRTKVIASHTDRCDNFAHGHFAV